ncbi:hypothetical protein WMF38_44805 [Sorangium sp. So ce118]
MRTKTRRAFVWCAGECAIALLALGCAQIFGFDKTYETSGGGSGGGGAAAGSGAGGAADGGAGGAAAGGGAGGTAGGGAAGAAGGGAGGAAGGGGGETAAGGGGGGPCAVLEVMPGEILDLSMIDDMEDGDLEIPPGDGAAPRAGGWFKDNDLSADATQEPANEADLMTTLDPPRGDSRVAVHTSADDRFTVWGAGVAVFLNSGEYYDASGYRGITFWARAEERSATRLKVMFVDRQTRHTGGICDAEEAGCGDHFHKHVVLANDWKRFKIPVECLGQEGFGARYDAPALDQLWGFYFSVGPGQAFDIWVDDVAFYR